MCKKLPVIFIKGEFFEAYLLLILTGQKGGPLPGHIPVLDIYVSAPPLPGTNICIIFYINVIYKRYVYINGKFILYIQ